MQVQLQINFSSHFHQNLNTNESERSPEPAKYHGWAGACPGYDQKPTRKNQLRAPMNRLIFSVISWYLWTSQHVINVRDLDEQAGHLCVWHQSKYANFIVTDSIKFCLRMPIMVSFFLVSFRVQQTLQCSRILLSGSSNTGKWPKSKSILVMDNAFFHHSDRIEEMCLRAGVKLVYSICHHTPRIRTPLKSFFAEFKAFVRRNWQVHVKDPHQESFLEWNNEVEKLLAQVMTTQKQVLGPEHPSTLEAEELQVQVMETRKQVLGPRHSVPRPTLKRLQRGTSYRTSEMPNTSEPERIPIMITTLRLLQLNIWKSRAGMEALINDHQS
ncbi:hypothetical protein TSTA_062000 [Talaromyces stipitatus ATCC 10500]|uniref:Tc1-like transposase DDE domain-containing protein n=1 Tax=Talaromyces stipitatus (strain ATCC 10500 / CBS 375.48 / QM 6759 / NRRL 1006) TaxID=441959 RepID=B8LX62_TALSN|nr:uncharacterized protein TSTA_062000 [Talaromyces stipitatus ATCC 10500]EED22712.1 hypothetical protein TSTA_062000 [Talaromyces stipitatus ATCC 10500]